MQLYEAMFLLDNREVKKGFDAARERVSTLLTKHGAKPRVVRKWDERKLAYEIARQKRATYMLAYFDAPSDAVAKIRHDSELTEFILRVLVVRAEAVPEKAMTEPFDAAIAPQAEEAPPVAEPVAAPEAARNGEGAAAAVGAEGGAQEGAKA